MLNRDEYRQMLLAGSVTFPATFPQVGRLTLCVEPRPGRPSEALEILSVEEYPSPRVTLSRRVLMASVRAVFLPRDARAVRFSDGHWLLEDEVSGGLKQRLADSAQPLYGIVFVPENEPSMLHVSAGMTAAESSQYYPPLPGDLSHNHYNPWPAGSALSNGLGNTQGVRPMQYCSLSDDPSIQGACSSMDPFWEHDRAKTMPTAYPNLQEVAAADAGQSLVDAFTVAHVGFAPRSMLEPEVQAVSRPAPQPFPTDDL